MRTKISRTKGQRPLATVQGTFKAEIYQAKFRRFETTKYLNLAAVKAARNSTIEIGTVEAAGVTATLAAEIREGMITKLKPVSCSSRGAPNKGKLSAGAAKKLQLEVLKRVKGLGTPPVRLPVPVEAMDEIIEIDLILFYILIGVGPLGVDFCIPVTCTDGTECSYCLFLPPACSQTGPPM